MTPRAPEDPPGSSVTVEDDAGEPGDPAVIAVRGELDAALAPSLRRAARRTLDGGRTRIVIDLGGATFVDSTGLGAIIAVLKAVRPAGGDVALVVSHPAVERTFEITGMAEIARVVGRREDAVAALRDPAFPVAGGGEDRPWSLSPHPEERT